jgi:hypothetical protein
MKNSSIFIGLDVHKSSIDIALAEAGRNSEVRSYGKIDGSRPLSTKSLENWFRKGVNYISSMCNLSGLTLFPFPFLRKISFISANWLGPTPSRFSPRHPPRHYHPSQ